MIVHSLSKHKLYVYKGQLGVKAYYRVTTYMRTGNFMDILSLYSFLLLPSSLVELLLTQCPSKLKSLLFTIQLVYIMLMHPLHSCKFSNKQIEHKKQDGNCLCQERVGYGMSFPLVNQFCKPNLIPYHFSIQVIHHIVGVSCLLPAD